MVTTSAEVAGRMMKVVGIVMSLIIAVVLPSRETGGSETARAGLAFKQREAELFFDASQGRHPRVAASFMGEGLYVATFGIAENPCRMPA